jgi:thioredoxin reductase (NADPH)
VQGCITKRHLNIKIKFIWNTVVTEVLGDEAVKAVCFKNVVTEDVSDYPADGLFVFIGHRPNTQLFAGQLDLDDRGYIKTNVTMNTNIPGVYVAGEAGDPTFRQVVTSAGMGAAAAMQAIKFLEENS